MACMIDAPELLTGRLRPARGEVELPAGLSTALGMCPRARHQPRQTRGIASAADPASSSGRDRSLVGGRRYEMQVDHVKPEAGDPLHEPGKGPPIRQFSAQGRGAVAHGDLAVVELRRQRGARLTDESDLIRLWFHQDRAPQSAESPCRQSASRQARRHHPPRGDPRSSAFTNCLTSPAGVPPYNPPKGPSQIGKALARGATVVGRDLQERCRDPRHH